MMIGAALGLLFGIGPALSAPTLFAKIIFVLDWAFTVYLLIFLNTAEAKVFFNPGTQENVGQKSKIPIGLKILIGALILIGVIVGSILFGVRSIMNKAGRMEIWLEDVRTGKTFPVTNGGPNSTPRFSPNGRSIAYSHSDGSPQKGGSAIQVYSITEVKSVTIVGDGHVNSNPSWGPDGQRILYTSKNGQETDLWICSIKDGQKTQVTHDKAVEEDPVWSPDGKWIVFRQEDEQKRKQLYLIPSEGGSKHKVTNINNFLYEPKYPTWTPDSQEIVFFSFVSLVSINPEGKVQQEINLAGLNNFKNPGVSRKDPNLIMFSAKPAQDLSMKFNLYVISRKTQRLAVLKDGRNLLEFGYDLSPDGETLVYARPS